MSKPIYLLGDSHAEHDGLLETLDGRNDVEPMDGHKVRNAIVIHVGDGFEGLPDCTVETLKSLNKEFADRGIEYLGIRGNHCDPGFFDGQHQLSNLKLIPDYTRLEMNGESWLFVGGAVSVNRIDKKDAREWFAKEKFFLDPSMATKADVLVTHSGPSWIGPKCRSGIIKEYEVVENYFGTSTLVSELKEERKQHDQLFRLVRPKTWYCGHFHERAEKHQHGCTARILNCLDLFRHTPR